MGFINDLPQKNQINTCRVKVRIISQLLKNFFSNLISYTVLNKKKGT